MHRKAKRIRDTVYVIGAGFSAGLGYPLTTNLLIDVWDRLPDEAQEQLAKIIEFHHPNFSRRRPTSYPEIEQLLTEMAVNHQMFSSSRRTVGRFTDAAIIAARDQLLSCISDWFHEIHGKAVQHDWLIKFVAEIKAENAAVISFNWDLVLDQLLFDGHLSAEGYGLSPKLGKGTLLLKPHGSLNWYQHPLLRAVDKARHIEIYRSKDRRESVRAFLLPRGIKSNTGKRYNPLIIPPTFIKDFRPRVFQRLWRRCTDVLSTARKIVFLGYSLPTADSQAHFIFRCGFHNQLEGRIKSAHYRHTPTGPSKVVIVNPDQSAAKRIEAVAGPKVSCSWVPMRLQEWLEDEES